jgi:hypothetical protein
MMASLTKSHNTFVYLLIKAAIVSLVVLLLASCNMKDYGTKLKFKDGELYYTKNVAKEDADKLGNYLVDKGFFSDDKRITVQLDKGGKDTVLFRFVVIDSFVNKPQYADLWQAMAGELSKDVFSNKPVTVHFCDKYLTTKKVIEPAPAAPTTDAPAE